MYKYFKRLVDLLLALILGIIILPFMLIVGLYAVFFVKEGIIFTQDRIGLNNKKFKLYKLRTMTNERDSSGNLLPDSLRLTKLGRIIRSLSLDELPQILNVLKGEMSFVGPRPLLLHYLPLYNQRQIRRHEVRPGITGWAQINGRNSITWKDRLEYDVFYVESFSFMMDLKIFYMTVIKVLKREGISGDNAATMKPFTGDNS
jgi:undecaprenyl phosphate N,N'-diacetylbacillosamine 1-phosphate transferase